MPSFRRFHGVNLVAQYTRAASGDEAVTKSGDPGPEKNIAARMGWRLRRARGRPIGAMANAHLKAGLAALHHAWARLDLHWRAMAARDARRSRIKAKPGRGARASAGRWRRLRAFAIGAGVVTGLASLAAGALWWRLGSGPLSVDIVTPWLTAAVEERLGGGHRIEVGGTQLERTEDGRAALRLRDIIVRDPDGTVVASAPKAEVGISSLGLLTGHLQAQRLSLIGAAMAVRVERDGQLTIFAGADKRPIAKTPLLAAAGDNLPTTAAAPPAAPAKPKSAAPGAPPKAPALAGTGAAAAQVSPDFWTTLLGWLDGLDALGPDGRDLTEIGLKNGSLVVDDMRTGKRWSFADINLGITRPKEGGVAFAINSRGTDGLWSMTATVTPRGQGRRAIEAVLRDLSPKDLLLALRLGGDTAAEADMPISAILRAEIGADGVPQSMDGRILLGAGYVGNPDDPDDRILVDEGRIELRWDPAKRQLSVPIELLAGANRMTLFGLLNAPRQTGESWGFAITRGLVMLASADRSREAPLVLDRVLLRGRLDVARRRLELDQGDLSGMAASVAFSGALDYSGAEPRLTAGMAGTRMSASALKRIWPVFVASKVRAWAIDHIQSGTVERFVIAVNAPLPTLKASGPPVPDDGLSVELVSTGVALRPVETLPVIRDADLALNIIGRNAKVSIGRGVAELSSGRKLNVAGVLFEVPDTFPKAPPGRLRFHVDGPVDAAAELVGLDPLREACDLQLDPATSRGSLVANVTVALPITKDISRPAVQYGVEADFSNFSAERLIRNQKVEAAALHLSANSQAIQVKGDMRIGGTPASVDYRIGGGTADVRAQATLDDAARSRLGFEANGAISGPIPVKLSGKIGSTDRDSRLNIEADLTQAKITELLPGWTKPHGRSARASFVLAEKPRATRLEDLVIDAPGTSVKGMVEIDSDGEITLASFPVYALSDGDKASLRAERTPDGVLKVVMRGDVYDGRGLVKGAMSGPGGEQPKSASHDLDLDVKVGAMAGFNGEALRGLDLKLSRRAGQIRSFGLNARLGQDATLSGDLRGYANGRNVVYFETNDAGALFRFTDTYPRIGGGQMWIAMDPPTADQQPRDGVLNVRDFVVRGEPALERMAAAEPMTDASMRGPVTHGVSFSRFRVEFTRSPGRLTLRDGVVWGPTIGATMEGQLDYGRDAVSVRGTFIPAYALNNMFGRLPFVGPLLGGQNEGLLGVTYEVVGPPHAPTLRVNPISAVAPGFLRKLFEFRGQPAETAVPSEFPTR